MGFAVIAPLLGGCTEPEAAPAEGPAEVRMVQLDPVVLVEGTFQWHETGGSNALEYYDLASQAAAHPCIWDGSGDEEPYFNNRHLPTAGGSLGPWSGNVTFTLDWTEQDWIGTALRVAYRAPGLTGWTEAGPIERGTDFVERIAVHRGNATEADGEESSANSDWSVWVCLPTDSGNPEEPFVGSFTAGVVFVPDPIPESELEPAGSEGGRTARAE